MTEHKAPIQRIKIGTVRSSLEILKPGTYRDGDHAVVLGQPHRVMRVERFGYEDKRRDSFMEDRPGQWGPLSWHVSHYDWSTAAPIDRSRMVAETPVALSISWWRRLLAFLMPRRRASGMLPEARVMPRETSEIQSSTREIA